MKKSITIKTQNERIKELKEMISKYDFGYDVSHSTRAVLHNVGNELITFKVIPGSVRVTITPFGPIVNYSVDIKVEVDGTVVKTYSAQGPRYYDLVSEQEIEPGYVAFTNVGNVNTQDKLQLTILKTMTELATNFTKYDIKIQDMLNQPKYSHFYELHEELHELEKEVENTKSTLLSYLRNNIKKGTYIILEDKDGFIRTIDVVSGRTNLVIETTVKEIVVNTCNAISLSNIIIDLLGKGYTVKSIH